MHGVARGSQSETVRTEMWIRGRLAPWSFAATTERMQFNYFGRLITVDSAAADGRMVYVKVCSFQSVFKILRTAKTFLGFSGWGGCHGWFLCLFWWDRFKQAIEIWRTTKAALGFSGVREGGRGWLWVAAVTPHLCSEWGHYSWIGGRHEGALWSNMFGDSPLSSFTSQV